MTPSFFERDATEVAPDLLGCIVEFGGVRAHITEVEAYTADDPASHSFCGPTARNKAMFGPAGRLYVYLIYGLHHCANIVTGAEGDGQAVLLRAAVVDGVACGRTNGPGKLARHLGIDRSHDGSYVRVWRDDPPMSGTVRTTPRIGIAKAVDWPRRWLLTLP